MRSVGVKADALGVNPRNGGVLAPLESDGTADHAGKSRDSENLEICLSSSPVRPSADGI